MEWYNLQLYLPYLAPMMSQNLRHGFYKVWFSPIIPVIRTQVNDLHSVKNNILKEITDLPAISYKVLFVTWGLPKLYLTHNFLNIYCVPSTVLKESKWMRNSSCPGITYSVVKQQVTQDCFSSYAQSVGHILILER